MEQSIEFCLQTALKKERLQRRLAASVQYQRVPVCSGTNLVLWTGSSFLKVQFVVRPQQTSGPVVRLQNHFLAVARLPAAGGD